MRFSISLFASDRGLTPAAAARAAEERGFHALYVPEHTHIPVARSTPHPETEDESLPDDRYLRTLDPWVSLASAVETTSRIRLGTAVSLPVEHDPISLAKTIATVDFLSGGRVNLGVGFGWNLDEMADHGVNVGRRRAVLAEWLSAMEALWTQEEASFEGEFVSFGASWAWPKPIQTPRVPILVGAFGTERTFRWIAEHADGWLTTPIEEGLPESLATLRRVWAEAGRQGRPQVALMGVEPTDESVGELGGLGVTEMVLGLPDVDEDGALTFLDDQAQLVKRWSELTRMDGARP
jgi:probable F420-dependent oxidoreductase